jgi:hypothetical protein
MLCKILDLSGIDDEQAIVNQSAMPMTPAQSVYQQNNEQIKRLVQTCATVECKKSYFTKAVSSVKQSMNEVSLKSLYDKNVKQPQIDYSSWNHCIV